MSTDTSLDVSFWEKLSDGISAFSEGVGRFFLSMFGDSDARTARKLGYVRAKGTTEPTIIQGSMLHQVNSLEETMRGKTPEQLKEVTPHLRQKLQ